MLCPAKPTHAMLQVFFSGSHFYLLVVGMVPLNLNIHLNNFQETFVREGGENIREGRENIREEGENVREG